VENVTMFGCPELKIQRCVLLASAENGRIMARIRYLKPEFFFDDDLAELDFGSRLFFQGLWCYADREGRLEDKPKVLKAQIMPYDSISPDKILDKLEGKFIIRYEVDGRKYIQINNFIKHQKPHHTEKESLIPEHNGVLTVKQPSKNTLKEKEKEKDKEKDKEKCLEFVFLLKSEHDKLLNQYGVERLKVMIENLNNYLGSTGKRYKSHYHTLLAWERKNGTGVEQKQPRIKFNPEVPFDEI
jgi:hypothetical protein